MIPLPKDLAAFLRDSGVEVVSRREIAYGTQYFLSNGPDSANLTLYRTGNAVVGGKPASELRRAIEKRLAKETPPSARNNGQSRPPLDAMPRAGIDEAGKGDYFGPLVVAGVRVLDEGAARELQEIGVRDSKALSIVQAHRFAERILDAVGAENACVVSLSPREFERRREEAGNVNRLLEEVDAEIIGELKDQVEVIVVDQFAAMTQAALERFVPEGVRLEVRKKADRDDAAVAAASILARARYLEDLERLSEETGFELPRGATHVVETGRRVAREGGEEKLKDVAKVSFSTTAQVLGRSGG
ncbi:MAG TPA: hypothetical protein VFE21_09055 [Rubrobacteraceae bacterium]|nr:hypothetical protein [Rubrobacteraceae bacterium]